MKTLQETFDKVVKHLRQQGIKATNSLGICLYRTKDGLMCGVGCLIEDEEYDPLMEGSLPSVVAEKSQLFKKDYGDHLEFLQILQSVHDDTAVDKWEERLQEIATEYGLSFPSPTETSIT